MTFSIRETTTTSQAMVIFSMLLCIWPDRIDMPTNAVQSAKVNGPSSFYHYGCDAVDDRGWGCGYRTIQTLCSWVLFGRVVDPSEEVPSLLRIQQELVALGDKQRVFIGSHEWVGSVEASFLLDQLYGVQCRLIHVRCDEDLTEHVIPDLLHHFNNSRAPVMMGGNNDAASKCVLGVCYSENVYYILILDPHYYGPTLSIEEACSGGWLAWRSINSFDNNSFYNFCLPQSQTYGHGDSDKVRSQDNEERTLIPMQCL
uniref:UFM1-specific peptidase 1 (non-functional) n=1 Tax=Eptatretus burgeri TaxID=7764 RepID=A0A8C4R7R0_EPTBU